MRLYEDRDNKREISCGYCQHSGHNKRNCPHMKAQWDANPQVHEIYDHDSLIGVDKSMFPTAYQTYYSDIDAIRRFRSHWRYMVTRFAPKTEVKTKRRKKPSCGFCGSTAHNRRNCNKLKNFVYVLKETNKAYRSAYYDEFIDKMGLGAGALITVRGSYEKEDRVGIITTIKTEDIMFTNLLRSWNDYSTRAKAKVMINGGISLVSLTQDAFYHGDYTEINEENFGEWKNFYSSWGAIKSIVSPAPNRPSKEWFLGQSPCFEWVVKKRDNMTLMANFHSLIKKFYPHNDLRTKLGAKVYDQLYTK